MLLRLRKLFLAAGAVFLAAAAVSLHYGLVYRYAHLPLRTALVPQPYARMGQSVDSLVFSADGRTLIAADTQLGLSQWSVPALHCQNRTLQHVGDRVSAAYLSPHGDLLSFAESNGVGRWNLNPTGFKELPTNQVGFRRIPNRNETWKLFQFHTVSPSGRLAAGADAEGDVVTWDIHAGRRLYAEDAPPPGKYGYPTSFCDIAFSPDDRYMALSSLTGDDTVAYPALNIVIRDAQTGKLVQRWQWKDAVLINAGVQDGGSLGATGLVFSPDGLEVAAADMRSVAIWDVASGKLHRSMQKLDSQMGGTKKLVFFDQGRQIAGCGWMHCVPIWDADSGNLLQTFYSNSFVEAVAVSPDSKLLATGGQDAGIVTSRETGRRVTPDNKMLLTGQQIESVNGSIALWDISRLTH